MLQKHLSSFNTKIIFSLFLLGIFLLSILFIQIIPNLQNTQRENIKNQIQHMTLLTTQQIKLAIELIKNHEEQQKQKLQSIFYNATNKAFQSLNNYKKLVTTLQTLEKETKCKVYHNENKEKFAFLKNNTVTYVFQNVNHTCPRKIEKILYKLSFDNQTFTLSCNPKNYNSNYSAFEEKIRDNILQSLQYTHDDHKGKVSLFWINPNNTSKKPLYNLSDTQYNPKYCVSKMSSSLNLTTGSLQAQQIIQAANTSPLKHIVILNNEKKIAYSWIRLIDHTHSKYPLYSITTVYKEDLDRTIYAPLQKILPAAIIAFITAMFIGLLLFRRLFKKINLLTHTIKKINSGNRSVRSNITGNDDIALLGKTFDKMMDSIENNIAQLDNKVAEKTKELSSSLEEKETLLKEVHHRVKNNLAHTINLVKMQKYKINDKKTKDVLTDLQERIFTMELLHRKLYESKDLHHIPICAYINDLAKDLDTTYNINQNITLTCSIKDITMSIEYALPCGLVITESLINAYKYAFENNQKGEIHISLAQKGKNYTLKIADTGKGLPKSIDIYSTKTLGLRLITSIVSNQLMGNIKKEECTGTCFIITFQI